MKKRDKSDFLIPGQYTLEEFNKYLDIFEENLKKGDDNFYTHKEVMKMMEKW